MAISDEILAMIGQYPSSIEILNGTVISASPLKIAIDGDQKRIATDDITSISKHLTDYTVECDISFSPIATTQLKTASSSVWDSYNLKDFSISKASIKLYDALKINDRVQLVCFNTGQFYYVIDRVV